MTSLASLRVVHAFLGKPPDRSGWPLPGDGREAVCATWGGHEAPCPQPGAPRRIRPDHPRSHVPIPALVERGRTIPGHGSGRRAIRAPPFHLAPPGIWGAPRQSLPRQLTTHDQLTAGRPEAHRRFATLLDLSLTRVLDKRNQRETALALAWGFGKPDGKRGEGASKGPVALFRWGNGDFSWCPYPELGLSLAFS